MAEAEVANRRSDRAVREPLRFTTNGKGNIQFGSQIEHVDMVVPSADVAVGPGPEAVLDLPVSIDAGSIFMDADRIVTEESKVCSDEESGIAPRSDETRKAWSRGCTIVCRSARSGVSLGLSGSWRHSIRGGISKY